MTPLALIGAKSLYILYAWLICAALSSYLSERKGYGEKPGLATGLFLFVISVLIWLLMPAKHESKWVTAGWYGSETKADRAAGKRKGER
jgi:hypothetical protein